MIRLKSLTFAYPQSSPIFEEYDWFAGMGEAWAVLGPSGGGKSTLLSLIAGLLLPTGGEIWIDDQLLTRPRPRTGLIIQDYGLLPWATVRRNAELGWQIRKYYGPDGKHAPREYQSPIDVEYWLDRLGILQVADKYPGEISGGQRQRTAIARTLALKPDLLLMDEPFSSLDAPTRESLQGLTLELQAEQGLTLVIVTHAIEEAAVMGRQILLLNQPPNTGAMIIDNPCAGSPDFRNSPEYLALCRDLRLSMELQ